MKKDYYEVLNIQKSATKDEIKKAYRLLAKKYHPDTSKIENSEEKFKEATEAYEILSDEAKKAQYDKFGHNAFDPNSGFGSNPFSSGFGGFSSSSSFSEFNGFESIFSDFFGGFGANTKTSTFRQIRGDDYQAIIKITFIESVLGKNIVEPLEKFEKCDKCNGTGARSLQDIITCKLCNGRGEQIKVSNTILGQIQQSVICSRCDGIGQEIAVKCHKCKGTKVNKVKKNITIKIPPGIKNGQNLRVEGYGGPGINGGNNGDLVLSIQVKPHKHFSRRNDDILLKVPISIKSVISEEKIEIPTPYGLETISLNSNIKTGDEVVLKNKGFRTKYESGKLILVFEIYIPKLSNSERNKIIDVLENNNDKTYNKWLKDFK